MNWVKRHKALLAFVAVVIAAAWGVNENAQRTARDAAQTNYENQISSCRSGNALRFVTHDFLEAAIEARTDSAREADPAQARVDLHAAARYRRNAKVLENIPGGRPDGTRECLGQIEKP